MTAQFRILAAALVAMLAGCADGEGGSSGPRTGVDSDGMVNDARVQDAELDAGPADMHVDDAPDANLPDMPIDPPDNGVDANVDAAIDAAPTPDMGPPPACAQPELAEGEAPAGWTDAPYQATVTQAGDPCARSFTLQTNQPLRDDQPANPRVVRDPVDGPASRTGSPLFDGLYALALTEVEECAVDAIRDFAFGDGQPLPCPPGGCFETGRLWNYVWTRDTAYAVDLGLASMDPTRARNSLEFKLSARRGGDDTQIVQDTGTGGSYPISSDRAVWAFGARALMAQLDGAEREGFADLSWEAAQNTLEHDRVVVFDPTDGLYRGEQSFLDWREQTYPRWVQNDLAHIGMSKALSTNLGHLALMELAATLGETLGNPNGPRYRRWATDLRAAIRAKFWDAEAGMFRTFQTTTLDPAAARQYDALGMAHAVLAGLDGGAQAVANYPLLPKGPAVIWPQQQDTPIYHNRGQWPFVTAYWLRAARKVGNDAVIDNTLRALVRGAAMNLSNMENFEMVSGLPWVEDGAASGPVVNSQRQLWSVAGYLTAVHEGVFGLEPIWSNTGDGVDGLRVAPRLTAWMRAALFPTARSLILDGYVYRGRTMRVELRLPAVVDADETLIADTITVDGQAVGALIPPAALNDGAHLLITLRGAPRQGQATIVDTVDDYQTLFAPRPPAVLGIDNFEGQLQVRFDTREPGLDLPARILRDGVIVAEDVRGGTWLDLDARHDGPSHCYTIETTFPSGNTSQRANPYCWWGESARRVQTMAADLFEHDGGNLSDNHGRPHIEVWGDEGHAIRSPFFAVSTPGPHLIQVNYGNGAGGPTTGITCAVKRVRVIDDAGTEHGSGYLAMPHIGDWSVWRDSGFVEVNLPAAGEYRVILDGDDRAVNMSVFEHFSRYTGGTGGRDGAFNRVNISAIKVLARQ